MKTPRFPRIAAVTAVALATLAATTAAHAKKPVTPDVLVVADRGPDVKDVPTPTAAKPAYYFLLSGMERGLGDSIAGEPMPEKTKVEAAIRDALATRHYLPTQVGGPMPDYILVYSYGSANLSTMDFDETDDDGNTSTSTVSFNSREMSQLVGLDKARNRAPFLLSTEADEISDAYRSDRVYILIAALDAQSLRQKKKKLIWRTRMSIYSQDGDLPSQMKAMLASAAPYFGQDEDMPLTIDDATRRKTEVHIGEATVIPDDPHPRAK